MPTILRWNGYRFYFFSNEGVEPPHVHVDKGGVSAKIWLDPVAVARNIGYSTAPLTAEAPNFIEAWHGHFSG